MQASGYQPANYRLSERNTPDICYHSLLVVPCPTQPRAIRVIYGMRYAQCERYVLIIKGEVNFMNNRAELAGWKDKKVVNRAVTVADIENIDKLNFDGSS